MASQFSSNDDPCNCGCLECHTAQCSMNEISTLVVMGRYGMDLHLTLRLMPRGESNTLVRSAQALSLTDSGPLESKTPKDGVAFLE
ncbi:Uncharacterized protein HZ326_9229 [Fusarium oxysporum f. sp. albedinis]|nr:Uncharacterized protein HZ326_9229 [Fusarium oxysporum f. sp. albedinis]